jgi:hypothetical protein
MFLYFKELLVEASYREVYLKFSSCTGFKKLLFFGCVSACSQAHTSLDMTHSFLYQRVWIFGFGTAGNVQATSDIIFWFYLFPLPYLIYCEYLNPLLTQVKFLYIDRRNIYPKLLQHDFSKLS